jgi:uncharacterized repeat protein (TIGR03803 family)
MFRKNSTVLLVRAALLALATVLLLSGIVFAAPTETLLYVFGTNPGDGSPPSGKLLFDSGGAIYGTTESGGTNGFSDGTVFKLTPPATQGGAWTQEVLYSFQGNNHGVSDGAQPMGGVVMDEAGALYGVTVRGGISSRGAIYKLTPPAAPGGAWTETILHFFGGDTNGMGPASRLLRVKSGALYGTTLAGGKFGAGTVFRLTPPAAGKTAWTLLLLYHFTGGADGGTPSGELVLDKTGALYGMTIKGGVGFGAVYKLTPPAAPGGTWTEGVLYPFDGHDDGANPRGGLVRDTTGTLYGTTRSGVQDCTFNTPCPLGTVFQLTPPLTPGAWSHTVLHSFSGLDGANPAVTLTPGLLPGVFYGTTAIGGKFNDGTLFKLTPPATSGGTWTLRTLRSFGGGQDGGGPDGSLVLESGTVYGTLRAGPSPNGSGAVFELVP